MISTPPNPLYLAESASAIDMSAVMNSTVMPNSTTFATTFFPTASPTNNGTILPVVPPAPEWQPQQPMVYDFISPYTIFLIVAVLLLVGTRLIQIYHIRQNQRLGHWNDSDDDETRGLNHHSTLAVKLDLDDRIKLYHRAFDRNQRVHTLTAEDFLPNETETNGNGESRIQIDDIESSGELRDNSYDNYDDDEDEPALVYLPMESSTDVCQCQVCPKEGKPPTLEESGDTVADQTTPTTTPQMRTGVPGQCIICIEHFEPGDKVVWSETPGSCQHVYHEDCMVHYLASHSMRTKQLVYPNDNNHQNQTGSYSENPCPTCRQRFCTISREDLILAVLLKSVQVALLEEDEEEQQQQPPSSSGAESQGPAPTDGDDSEIGIALGQTSNDNDGETDRGERIATVTSLALATVTICNGGSLAATGEISTPSPENNRHDGGDDSSSDSNSDENNSTTQ
jgi:hypothetical protein